ncbi:hypothetical protein DPMN_039293 [Dreissena polymorpha]|uniref:Uncharacterized protein n=1 Tax=Dreissena polymorpha TaxID=45954 RepID=A0A9D4RR62_DREPO|nr:hypothetical protein DPMN_039293 [Dreissena polymorpha]
MYLRRWRRFNAEAEELAGVSSSESEGDLSNTSGSDEAIQNIPADLNYDSDAEESSLDNSIYITSITKVTI